jgi:hypothetical protein
MMNYMQSIMGTIMNRKILLRFGFIVVGISFLSNLIWENVQMPLYQGYTGFLPHFLICLKASFADVFIVLLIYFVFALIYKDWYWIRNIQWGSLLALFITGGSIALIIEYYALGTHKWSYTSSMPLVPLTHVGLLPVLQMSFLPFVTFYMSYKLLLGYINRYNIIH